MSAPYKPYLAQPLALQRARHEVALRCGTLVTLRPVGAPGAGCHEHPGLYALRHGALHHVFDLEDVAAGADAALRARRGAARITHLAELLSHHFPSAAAFREAVVGRLSFFCLEDPAP